MSMPSRSSEHVVIVGGGITGLSAAWYLQQQAEASGIPVRYTLIEASDRWGGKIRTERIDERGRGTFVIEAGPDSFLTQKPWAWQLAHELVQLLRACVPVAEHIGRALERREG